MPKLREALLDAQYGLFQDGRVLVERVSTGVAPWTLAEADDKLHARAKVLDTICDRVEAALKRPS